MDWLKKRQANKVEEMRQRLEAEQAQKEAEQAYWAEIVEDYGFVQFERSGGVQLNINNAAESKLAIKQLRLKKKELATEKREAASEIAGVRAEYRTKAAGRVYMGRGGGKSGALVRGAVRAKRRGERMAVEESVVPLEEVKRNLDARMNAIDRAIMQIETWAASGEWADKE